MTHLFVALLFLGQVNHTPATPKADAKGIVWANDGFYYCAKDRGYCLMPTNAEIIAHSPPQPCDITSLGGDCGYLFREAHAKQ